MRIGTQISYASSVQNSVNHTSIMHWKACSVYNWRERNCSFSVLTALIKYCIYILSWLECISHAITVIYGEGEKGLLCLSIDSTDIVHNLCTTLCCRLCSTVNVPHRFWSCFLLFILFHVRYDNVFIVTFVFDPQTHTHTHTVCGDPKYQKRKKKTIQRHGWLRCTNRRIKYYSIVVAITIYAR